MIKKINEFNIIYNGYLIIYDLTKKEIKKVWEDFSKGKNPNDFFDGDIYCVTDIDYNVSSIKIKKTKYSYLIYAKKTNKLIIRSLFSAGYIRTIDNYVCIILNDRDRLNTIGGMADNQDIKDDKFDYEGCLIREFNEELGIDLNNDSNFEIFLSYLKYPSKDNLSISFYPVGTLYEIRTKYTKKELTDLFNKSKHESEVKELKFYNKENYKEIFLYENKTEYLDELFNMLFEWYNS